MHLTLIKRIQIPYDYLNSPRIISSTMYTTKTKITRGAKTVGSQIWPNTKTIKIYFTLSELASTLINKMGEMHKVEIIEHGLSDIGS